jgi:hypothetical protein
MKRIIYLFLCLPILFQFCAGQTTPKKEFYSKDFNWRITIPENFVAVDSAEQVRMQNKGAAVIEKTMDTEVENHARILFSFRSDKMNYFECNYQPFDPVLDGDFLETWQSINNVLYETFITQMPGIKIDTTRAVEQIDNLTFQTFKANIQYPNKIVLHMMMYSRLFDKKEFTVNIMYVDEAKGEKLLNAWKHSTFGK